MKTRKKRAARFHSQSEAPQAPTGNQEEAQEEVFSPHCASDPGRAVLHNLTVGLYSVHKNYTALLYFLEKINLVKYIEYINDKYSVFLSSPSKRSEWRIR